MAGKRPRVKRRKVKMGITRVRPCLEYEKQRARDPKLRGRVLAVEICSPRGNILRGQDINGKSSREIHLIALGVDALRSGGFLPEMIKIPAGEFQMGSAKEPRIKPIKTVSISKFAIGKYPVTIEQWSAFQLATYGEVKVTAEGQDPQWPAIFVDWSWAKEYCAWLSKFSGRKFRLPTEAEWEYSARGTDGREYPWGNEWDPSKAAFNREDLDVNLLLSPVTSFPEGASPFGVMGLSGNVAEWTSDGYLKRFAEGYLPPIEMKIIRGGSWLSKDPNELRCASRGYQPDDGFTFVGFRVAEDI